LPLPSAGLAGTEIPLFARIVAIADVFDALSSRRSYKEPWPEERVLQVIREEAGKAFDPELVEIFIERFGQVKAAWARHPDQAHAG
jgi:putative two-component system response regulator